MFGRTTYGRTNFNRSFASGTKELRPAIDPSILKDPHNPALKELQPPTDADKNACRNALPREVMPIASYSWTNDEEPTIIVPGCPPIWQNQAPPFRVERDSGVSFIDQNRHRVPKYPLLPLVLAVDHYAPSFDFSSVDIVTDRNNLRKLLRWIDGTNTNDFRIDLQLVGSTVLFTRFESVKVEKDSARLGYGRNFEQYTTKRLAGCEKMTGHHRIISYEFGNLKLLVRFEVDACLHVDNATQARKDGPSDLRPIPGDDPDDLLAALRKMTISDDRIKIVPCGVLVTQSSLVEMSTKSQWSYAEGIDWQEYLPQLVLSQTPHHRLGVHSGGLFRRVEERTLNDDELSKEQHKQQTSYDKLCVLLSTIKDVVIAHGEDARLSLVFRMETEKLEVYSRKSIANALPDVWMDRLKRAVVQEPERVDNEADTTVAARPPADEPGDSNAPRAGALDLEESDTEEKPAESDGESDSD